MKKTIVYLKPMVVVLHLLKTLSDAVLETTIDRSDIESFLKIIYENIKDTIYDDALIVQGKKGFIDATKGKDYSYFN